MGGLDSEWLRDMLLSAPGLILSLVLHELAHARTALAFGDPTARDMGRISLNPLRHLDPIGTLALFFAGFGWARPVPVNPANLHPPGLGDVAVSLAGPMTNLGLAILFGLATRGYVALVHSYGWAYNDVLAYILVYTTAINVMLCAFNLIPLYPLDGHHVLGQIISPWRRVDYLRWQMHYGQMILIALIVGPRLLGAIGQRQVPNPLNWVFDWAMRLLEPLTGLGGS